jgi:hypothetical protein
MPGERQAQASASARAFEDVALRACKKATREANCASRAKTPLGL